MTKSIENPEDSHPDRFFPPCFILISLRDSWRFLEILNHVVCRSGKQRN